MLRSINAEIPVRRKPWAAGTQRREQVFLGRRWEMGWLQREDTLYCPPRSCSKLGRLKRWTSEEHPRGGLCRRSDASAISLMAHRRWERGIPYQQRESKSFKRATSSF